MHQCFQFIDSSSKSDYTYCKLFNGIVNYLTSKDWKLENKKFKQLSAKLLPSVLLAPCIIYDNFKYHVFLLVFFSEH